MGRRVALLPVLSAILLCGTYQDAGALQLRSSTSSTFKRNSHAKISRSASQAPGDDSVASSPRSPFTFFRSLIMKVKNDSSNENGTPNSQPNVAATKGLARLDMSIFAVYFCCAFAVTLPVDLMPMIAAEQASVFGPGFVMASFVAATASVSTLGGGVGKLVNGFICQGLGGRRSSSMYLIGMSMSLVLLSFNEASARIGWILSGLEFCSSMQWTACSLVLANHYSDDPARFATAIATLTLASTSGTLTAKAGGTALLHAISSWRIVARIGAGVALLGSLIMRTTVAEMPEPQKDLTLTNLKSNTGEQPNKLNLNAVKDSMKSVLGSRLFWQVGLAHATALMTRSADRVLGAFVLEATNLPRKLCGGLTACMTIGFLAGLSSSQKFYSLPTTKAKTKMLRNKYMCASLSVMGLALCANTRLVEMFIPSKNVLAAIIALCGGFMAFSLSFQVYQIPAMVASSLFQENKAVCLSLLDAFGFFLAAPVWAITGQLVKVMGENGWMATWTMLATLFALGGTVMLNVLPTVLDKQGGELKKN